MRTDHYKTQEKPEQAITKCRQEREMDHYKTQKRREQVITKRRKE